MSRAIVRALRSLTIRERQWFSIALVVFAIGIFGLLAYLHQITTVEIPTTGGQVTEGIIGAPRFINPLLAASDADRDLTAIIYSGLMRENPSGDPLPDLAQSYTVSPDGLTYTFVLKNNLTWHDGTALTADDVIFTIESAQDPLLKSFRRASWEGVKVSKQDEHTVVFTLKQAYPSFLDSATMGILPKHIWSQIEIDSFPLSKFNLEPIGSGPYQISGIRKNNLGIPEYYDLTPFKNFALGAPRISKWRLNFYPSESDELDAYRHGAIQSLSAISAESASQLESSGAHFIKAPMPKVFAVFFNQSHAPVLADKTVRQALDAAVDKPAIIEAMLHGYGATIDGPLPLATAASSTTTATSSIAAAKSILTKGGWTWNTDKTQWEKKVTTKDKKTAVTVLAFTLTTANTPELEQAASLIKAAWEQLGAKVDLKVYEIGDLNQNIIRPRQYDALFFGEILGLHSDLFPFWHSSQRLDPGLNIALYTNLKVDKLLEEARGLSDETKIAADNAKLQSLIAADVPAVFVYSPYFLYATPTELKNISLSPITTPSDRFLTMYQWYLETDRVWSVFVH